MLLGLAANLGHNVLGIGSEAVANQWGGQVLMAGVVALCALRCTRDTPDRGTWIAVAIAAASWGAGSAYWNTVLYDLASPPYPSPADVGFFGVYPAAFAGITLYLRASSREFPGGVWLDSLIGVLAIAALGVALLVGAIVAQGEGSTLELIVNAAYPILNLVLAALGVACVGIGAIRGRASDLLLGAGLIGFAASDTIYLYRVAVDSYTTGGPLDSGWLVGWALIALAAWQQPRAGRLAPVGTLRTLTLPFGSCLVSIGILVTAGLGSVEPAATLLAAAALLAAMVRMRLMLHELRLFAETRRQASTDELTGLPNRRWFDNELRGSIDRARAAGEPLALLVIDLDHFKELNDTLGHHAGDRVLAQLGPRIRTALRACDHVARLGGDEFAVLLPGAGAEAADGAGERIADALSERFSVEGIELQIAASIGIALFPEHGDDAETLLQRADVAMYQAKHRRSGTEFYARERDLHTRERLQLIGELRDAVAGDHLTLHFQPKLDLGRNRVIGVEALVRWPHPTRGMVAPDEFIPLAEQTGVIGPLTELVIRKALRQAADWGRRGIALTMAVNVSATNLIEDGWTEGVLAALEQHGVRPDRFVVEITEDVLMTDPDRSLTALAVLSAAGVRVALDDFGTGYSSLSYLKRLPVDELKIDRSFVFEMGTDPADAAIVQTAIDLGRRLGIGVAAEGVEDAATLRRLTEFGAMMAQGYHIARPMPADELEAWLAAGGFVLRLDDEDVERARPVDALHAVQLDVGRR
jgi:diguanylate cyclase (GGDEF)-like protein